MLKYHYQKPVSALNANVLLKRYEPYEELPKPV